MPDAHERLARILEGDDDYRVLRRVPTPSLGPAPAPDAAIPGLATAIVLDTETTGLDAASDEVIELAMVRVVFDRQTGAIGHVCGVFSGLRDPGRPIPPEITRLTGLDDETVAGHRIDADEVERFIADASLVVAHNSRFDRPFAERAWPIFARLPWACSLTQIDWSAERVEGAKLTHILAARGLFHRGHRAIDDALALAHLLGLPLRSGSTGFQTIYERTAVSGTRVWATGAPYEAKDILKRRGYRWSDGGDGAPRAWNIEVPEAKRAEEVAFLRSDVYRGPAGHPTLVPVTAYQRFSSRAGIPAASSGARDRSSR